MSTPTGVIFLGKLTREDLFLGSGEVRVPSPAGDTQVGTMINIDTFGYVVYQAWAPGFLPASGAQTTTVLVPGAQVHHKVLVSFDGAGYLAAPLVELYAKVSASGVVTVVLKNHDSLNIYSPGSGTIRVAVCQVPATL